MTEEKKDGQPLPEQAAEQAENHVPNGSEVAAADESGENPQPPLPPKPPTP